MTGATEEGSIVGHLRLDDSDWNATLDRAEAKAKGLGAVSPTVKVDAKVDEAIAKLAAVEAAEKKLNLATQQTQLAYQRLDEVQTKGGATQSRLMALHLAAARAENTEEAATKKLTEAKAALAAVNQAQAETEDETAAATNRSTAANDKSIPRWQMIAGLIAVLIPLLGPLAGYIVAVGGALAGMGAAGVLAIVGIVAQIKQGTDAGRQFSGGLQDLKGDLGELSQTAAVSMLTAFQQAVRTIDAAMPDLNGQIRVFSGLLGIAGNSILNGLVTALHILNPLFYQAGIYVDDLASGFEKWTSDGGLQKFASYAIAQLPLVAQTLGSLATAALHLVVAMAPLGTVILQGLTALGVVINAIPVNTLLELATAAGVGYAAFKLWGALAPMLQSVATAVGAVGIATQIAEGPIGWVTAGVSALAAVLAVGTAATSQQADATRDYTAALQEDNGAIGANVRAQAAKALQDAGALSDAQKLGISTKTLTEATLGNKDAQASVAASLKFVNDKLAEAEIKQGSLTTAQQGTAAAALNVADASNTQNKAIQDNIKGARQLATATDGATAAGEAQAQTQADVARATGFTGDQYDELAAKQDDATDATNRLKQALDFLNGKQLSAAQAQNQFDSSLANSDAHLDATGKMIDRANTLLDGNTAAAVKNRSELIQQAQAAETAAQAFRDNGGSADDTKQKLIDMKQAIIDNAVAHGEDAAQVRAFVDQIYKIPTSIPPTKLEVDSGDANAKIDYLNAHLAGIARQVNVNVNVNGQANFATSGGAKVAFAGGGTVGGNGGPQSDTVDARLSTGEEVTANPYASEWRPLLKLIGSGAPAGQIASKAAQMSGGHAAAAVQPVIHNHEHTWNITSNNPEAVAQRVLHILEGHGV